MRDGRGGACSKLAGLSRPVRRAVARALRHGVSQASTSACYPASMTTRLTREQLYAMVWDRPMTKLAAEFRLSDVALHKICRKHNVPTPPLGFWAKKAHDKPVRNTPLPTEHALGKS